MHSFCLAPDVLTHLQQAFSRTNIATTNGFLNSWVFMQMKWLMWKVFGQTYGYTSTQSITNEDDLEVMLQSFRHIVSTRLPECNIQSIAQTKCTELLVNDIAHLRCPLVTPVDEIHVYVMLRRDVDVGGGQITQHRSGSSYNSESTSEFIHDLSEGMCCVLEPQSIYTIDYFTGSGYVDVVFVSLRVA